VCTALKIEPDWHIRSLPILAIRCDTAKCTATFDRILLLITCVKLIQWLNLNINLQNFGVSLGRFQVPKNPKNCGKLQPLYCSSAYLSVYDLFQLLLQLEGWRWWKTYFYSYLEFLWPTLYSDQNDGSLKESQLVALELIGILDILRYRNLCSEIKR
jgi:hypothetical protein